MHAFGLTPGLDDAFLGVSAELGRNSLAANSLCICIQNDTSDDGYLANAVALARERIAAATAQGRSVHYFEAIPGSDRVAFEELRDLIPGRTSSRSQIFGSMGCPLRPPRNG